MRSLIIGAKTKTKLSQRCRGWLGLWLGVPVVVHYHNMSSGCAFVRADVAECQAQVAEC